MTHEEFLGIKPEDGITLTDKDRKTSVPYDPIFPLLNHSDCDGELTPEECSEVYPRLRELLSAYPYEYDKWEGMKLADMMEHCAKEGLTLEFV